MRENDARPPSPSRRAAELTAGFLAWKVADYAFDYALYPFAVFRFGPLWGGGAMAILSLLFCLSLLRMYDHFGRDWMGLEFAKGLRRYEGASRSRRALAWLLGRGDVVAFVALSVKFDPFVTATYLRRGAFNGMSRRDWRIFLGSWLIANVAWTLACLGGTSIIFSQWQQCAQ